MELAEEEKTVIRLGVRHGDFFRCPACGAPGRIDLETPPGRQPEFELSVWYNKHLPGWECSECWLK